MTISPKRDPGVPGLAIAAILLSGAVTMQTAPADATSITKAPAAPATKLKVDTVAKGLENPWGLQFLPDGRMLVTERPGRMRVITKDGKLGKPIAGVPKVVARNQGGLLDVALAKDFATSGTIFIGYAEPRDGGRNGTAIMRAKLVLDADGSGKLENQTVIFSQQPSSTGGYHFGCRIVVATDGSLFITLGDRYSLMKEAQNPGNHLGKIVRITADGKPHPDNPKSAGWAPEVWSIGHRNLQGGALDGNGVFWTTEHGPQGGDELNRPEAGKNYGWPVITYGIDYSGAKIGIGTAKDGMEQPVYYWNPSIATSGLAFYTADLFAGWKGNALAGGLNGQLSRLVMTDGRVVAEEALLTDRDWRIRDVRQGPDGAVYVLTDESSGLLVRLTPG
jgi:glucose/arabinose dehydrogenase